MIDNNGDAIENASVKIEDKENSEVFSGTTDSDGKITEQWLVHKEAITPDKFWTDKTPHTVTISKSGYSTRVIKYTMDQTRDEIEKLSPDGTNIQDSTLYDTTIY